jgi:hypothetical protein
MKKFLGILFILGVLVLGFAGTRASAAPVNVSGHWIGTSTSSSETVRNLEAFLNQERGRRFDGVMTVTADDESFDLDLTGTVSASRNIKIKGVGSDGGKVNFTGKVSRDGNTITGKYRVTGRRGERGTFTLTRE